MDNVQIVLLVISLWILIYVYLKVSNSSTPMGLEQLFSFFNDHKPDILLVVLIYFMILMYFKDIKFDLNTEPRKKLTSTLTVETFDDHSKSFCSSLENNIQHLEKECNDLSKEKCESTECCIVHDKKCVAGNKHGPKYDHPSVDDNYYTSKQK